MSCGKVYKNKTTIWTNIYIPTHSRDIIKMNKQKRKYINSETEISHVLVLYTNCNDISNESDLYDFEDEWKLVKFGKFKFSFLLIIFLLHGLFA